MEALNYKLVKKLKDAGFPQIGRGYCEEWEKDGSDLIYTPTVGELIDACEMIAVPQGDTRFKSLENNGNFGWVATGDHRCGACAKDKCQFTQGKFETEGKTKEEAVAKLWLKLNNKK